nr:unnamed protein product [Callosobruchus analis]
MFKCIHCNKTFASKQALDGHIIRRHPVGKKVHECTKCTYKTVSITNLKKHMSVVHYRFSTCAQCGESFKSKTMLDDHTIKKHPSCVSSVTRKVYRCTKCDYKTTIIHSYKAYQLKHPETDRICIQCNAMFKEKGHLQEHIVQKHPEFITSVTSRIHECTMCNFKTISNDKMQEHLLKHTETGYTCMHCSTAFKTDYSLNEHIIKKHPKFIASITRKIHACTKCTFKTVYTSSFQCHLLKHPYRTCSHCKASFTRQEFLNEHILQIHPQFTASIARKIHKCTTCDFSTTIHTEFKRHQLKHTDTYMCVGCDKTFIHKRALDEHIIMNHPSYISSVTSKIHECTNCNFKTTKKSAIRGHICQNAMLDEHIIKKHPSSIPSITRKIHKCTTCDFNTTILTEFKRHQLKHTDRNSNICVHCNKSFLNKTLLDDHIVKKHPSFIYSVTSKIRECTKCSYKTTIAGYLKRHMVQHPDGIPCMYCDKTFIHKRTLDEHIIKNHPSYISSVTNKIHKCTKCNFKTVDKRTLRRHVCQNDTQDLTCIHCNAMFKQKLYLQEHVIQNHPESVMSVTSRIHECTMCNFKTMLDDKLHEHLLKHTETTAVCIHCNEPFKSITMLDEHIIKKHPSSIPSITRKIHKCTTCDFSTTIHTEFKRHQLKHTDAYINRNSNICVHCNKSFLSKTLLDDHIVKKHPSFIYSVTSKIRECTKCSYKTTIAGDLKKHMMQHPDLSGGEIFNRCMYCDKTFIHKRTLGEHIIKNHPSYISSVTNKIHECTKCNFKTVDKRTLRRHGCQNVEVTELVLS